jgi:hypothetical protein
MSQRETGGSFLFICLYIGYFLSKYAINESISPITIPRSIRGAVSNVARSVPNAIKALFGSLFANSKKSIGLINFITAQITVAPKIALGSSDSKDASGSTARTNAPVIAPDHGVVAPASLFKELLPNEPPTGKEFEIAEAMLAIP